MPKRSGTGVRQRRAKADPSMKLKQETALTAVKSYLEVFRHSNPVNLETPEPLEKQSHPSRQGSKPNILAKRLLLKIPAMTRLSLLSTAKPLLRIMRWILITLIHTRILAVQSPMLYRKVRGDMTTRIRRALIWMRTTPLPQMALMW